MIASDVACKAEPGCGQYSCIFFHKFGIAERMCVNYNCKAEYSDFDFY